MTFATFRISGRTIAMSYLCIAVLVPSLIGVVVLREATMRGEMDRETARQLLVQAIAGGIAHSAAATNASLAILASDPSTRDAISSGELDVVEARFRRGMQIAGMKQIELRDPSGRPILRVMNDPVSSASPRGADLRFHQAVRGADLMSGEVVATVPITTLVNATAYSQSLGRITLNSRDGRVLADLEAGGRGEIVEVPETAGTTHVPVETGTSMSEPGTSMAFAVAGDLPIIVTIAASADATPWPWRIVLLDGFLLAVGWLVISSATRRQSPFP